MGSAAGSRSLRNWPAREADDGAAGRARFIDSLLGARQPQNRMRVVIAVRADSYGRCAEHREAYQKTCRVR
jgi:hypothetical protein